MKKIILLALLAIFTVPAMAQSEITSTDNTNEEEVFLIVEVSPEYPGGLPAMQKYLVRNIKYPNKAKKKNIQGRVIVSFVVEKDGSVSNVKALKSVHPLLDAEAVRVVKAMPKWKPGTQRGVPVRTQFNLPINFSLQ